MAANEKNIRSIDKNPCKCRWHVSDFIAFFLRCLSSLKYNKPQMQVRVWGEYLFTKASSDAGLPYERGLSVAPFILGMSNRVE